MIKMITNNYDYWKIKTIVEQNRICENQRWKEYENEWRKVHGN